MKVKEAGLKLDVTMWVPGFTQSVSLGNGYHWPALFIENHHKVTSLNEFHIHVHVALLHPAVSTTLFSKRNGAFLKLRFFWRYNGQIKVNCCVSFGEYKDYSVVPARVGHLLWGDHRAVGIT